MSRFFFHIMASLAEMERELSVKRTRAGLAVARKLGRIGGRKRQMTDSKVEPAKKLLASGVSATWPKTSVYPCQHFTAGFQPLEKLSLLYFPFSETTLKREN